MEYLYFLVLGAVQGLTEFLPISSSGHLVIFQKLFNLEDFTQSHLILDILLHFGTFFAVCIAFYKDVFAIIKEAILYIPDILKGNKRKNLPERKLLNMLVVATLPLFAILPFKDYIENIYARQEVGIIVTGFGLLLTAVLLFFSDKKKSNTLTIEKASYKKALYIGITQLITPLPGVSRSGTTISAGIFNGLSRELAVKFAFLMSLPATLGANILAVADIAKDGIEKEIILPCILGMAMALITGLLAIKFVRYIASKNKFSYFAVYCLLAGILVLTFNLF